jgi:hypothetical protein
MFCLIPTFSAQRLIRLPLRLLSSLLIPMALLCSSFGASAADVVMWNRNFDTAPVDAILALALRKTRDLYPAAGVARTEPMEFDQAIQALRDNDGRMDIISAAASATLERDFLTVRFPVLGGLLGQRVCLIRRGDEARFRDVQTAFDFREKNLRICQGEHWPDTSVLLRNGLPVATSAEYSQLFSMLQNKECDCFLRGAQEILPEYEAHQQQVMIEPQLLFTYTQPGYFYVNKNNPQLAGRVELGLLRAMDDGSYQKLFNSLTQSWLDELKLSERTVIPLNNPGLSSASRSLQSLSPLWYQP